MPPDERELTDEEIHELERKYPTVAQAIQYLAAHPEEMYYTRLLEEIMGDDDDC